LVVKNLLIEIVEILAIEVDYQLFEVSSFFLITFFYNLKEALILVLLVQAIEDAILVLPLLQLSAMIVEPGSDVLRATNVTLASE